MEESLRMNPPVNLLNRTALNDTILVGKYLIKKGQSVSAILRHVHRDPNIRGDDADVFRPERMLNGGFEAIPPDSFKPDLDSVVENLPTDRPCVIITATYEGKQSDNAKKFVA
ncbi:hypothetical protein VMCG_01783 [Cytospora schulzeri]|uniref:Uncharacterized protein n=1 Tax=Cytospora schulzeri TaxID=448051 RepID=A0A423X3G4_9PEZI|nr:hypothetical protein VMCG_01783 [Valsa malicola]